jgi:hypothetical protein
MGTKACGATIFCDGELVDSQLLRDLALKFPGAV